MIYRPVLSLWKGTLNSRPFKPTIVEIATAMAADEGFTLDEIKGPRRHAKITTVRFAIYAACRDAGYSFPLIGRRLSRDHTSILHGDRAHRQRAAQRMAAE